MQPFTLQLDGTPQTARQALGAVVCATVRSMSGKRLLDKGHIVTESDLATLIPLRDAELSLLMPGEGDLHEDEAALRLARAAAGDGVEVTGSVGARARLVARHKGLLRVDARALERMNGVESAS